MITISIFLLILLKKCFIASKALRFPHDWALMQTIIGLVALFIFIFTSPTFLHTIFLTFGSFSCCSINMMTVHTHRHAERHWRTRYCTRPFLWFTFPLFMRNGVSTCRCGITTDICTGDSLFFCRFNQLIPLNCIWYFSSNIRCAVFIILTYLTSRISVNTAFRRRPLPDIVVVVVQYGTDFVDEMYA